MFAYLRNILDILDLVIRTDYENGAAQYPKLFNQRSIRLAERCVL